MDYKANPGLGMNAGLDWHSDPYGGLMNSAGGGGLLQPLFGNSQIQQQFYNDEKRWYEICLAQARANADAIRVSPWLCQYPEGRENGWTGHKPEEFVGILAKHVWRLAGFLSFGITIPLLFWLVRAIWWSF